MAQPNLSKLTILFLFIISVKSCKSIKEIAGDKYLLENNIISKNNEELINDPIKFIAIDKPNKKTLGIVLRTAFYRSKNSFLSFL